MNLAGNAVQLSGQILDRGLEKQSVGDAAFLNSSINLFRDFRQRLGVGIEADKKLLRLALRRPVYKASVTGPNVENNAALVRLSEPAEFFRVQLSIRATADSS